MILSIDNINNKKLFYAYHLLCLSIMSYCLSLVFLIHRSYYQFYSSWKFPSIFEDLLLRSPMKMLFGGTELNVIFNILTIPAFFLIINLCKKKLYFPAHCTVFFYTLYAYLLMDDFREIFSYYWYANGGGGKSIILTHSYYTSYSSQIISSVALQAYVFYTFRTSHLFD